MKKDLDLYVLQLQKQMDLAEEAMEKAQEQVQKGMIKEEDISGLMQYCETVVTNYNRVLYCKYLLNLPPKFIQKMQQKKLTKKMVEFTMKNSDGDQVIKENDAAIEGICDITDKAESYEEV